MRTPRPIAILALAMLGLLPIGCSSDVKIGAVISQSGAVASPYGEKVKNGLDLALEEINAAGGFQGGKIELIYKDDATNPDRGRQVTEELIQTDGVRVIIGAVSSSVTLQIAPICEKSRVILLSPASSNPEISDAGEYIYRNWPSDILEGTAMAKFARDLGLERVAIFAQADSFGTGLRDVFSQQYAGRFRQVVKTFDFEENTTDFAAMVEEVKALKPDGIYIVSFFAGWTDLLKEIQVAKVGAVLMGSSAVTEDSVRQAGEPAENLVFPQPIFDAESKEPAVASFVSAYRARYSEDPEIYAAHGYDALKLIVRAMEQGGSAHPNDVKLGLRGIENYQGAAGLTRFDANGDVVRYPRIFIVRQGKKMPYDKFVDAGGSLFAGN